MHIYKEKNIKCKHNYRISGIFQKFVNINTTLIKISIDYKKEFKINNEINCNIGIINWVDEFVYSYFIERYKDNTFIEEEI